MSHYDYNLLLEGARYRYPPGALIVSGARRARLTAISPVPRHRSRQHTAGFERIAVDFERQGSRKVLPPDLWREEFGDQVFVIRSQLVQIRLHFALRVEVIGIERPRPAQRL